MSLVNSQQTSDTRQDQVKCGASVLVRLLGVFKSGCEWSDVERGVFSEVLTLGWGYYQGGMD